eukprot:3520163-Ditylum_brightwellii.AAC.1
MDTKKEKRYWCYAYIDAIRKYNVRQHPQAFHMSISVEYSFLTQVIQSNTNTDNFNPVKRLTTLNLQDARVVKQIEK